MLKYNNLIIKRMTLDNDDNNEYYNYGIQKEGSYVVNLWMETLTQTVEKKRDNYYYSEYGKNNYRKFIGTNIV